MKRHEKQEFKLVISTPSIVVFVLSIVSLIASLLYCGLNAWKSWWLIIASPFIVFFGLWILLFIFVFGFSFTCSKTKPYNKVSPLYHFMFNLSYACLIGCGRIRVKVKGLSLIPNDTCFLLVSNHRSKFDNMIQSYVLRKYDIAYISKPENFKIPFGCHYMNRNLYLKLERDSLKSSLRTIIKATDMLEKDVTSIGVYPEGTRSIDGNLNEFKPGCLKIASNSNKPIVVVAMDGTEKIHKNFPLKPTTVKMTIIKVLRDEVGRYSTTELADIIKTMIDDDLKGKEKEYDLCSI